MLKDLEVKSLKHPLVAVFKPVFEVNQSELEKYAGEYYRGIESSPLDPAQRDSLLDVFVSWLIERLGTASRKELNMILELPNIKDTVCGREILEEGRQEGRRAGSSQAVIRFLEGRFGKLSANTLTVLNGLSVKQSESLIGELAAGTLDSREALDKWLNASSRV